MADVRERARSDFGEHVCLPAAWHPLAERNSLASPAAREANGAHEPPGAFFARGASSHRRRKINLPRIGGIINGQQAISLAGFVAGTF